MDSFRFLVGSADAAVIHAFETYFLYSLIQIVLRRKTVIVVHPDGGLPGVDQRIFQSIVGRVRASCVRRTDLLVPWSSWARSLMVRQYPWVESKAVVLHPGIDLCKWRVRAWKEPEGVFRILFVGGDFVRKGGDVLLEAAETLLADCEINIATRSGELPEHLRLKACALPNVKLHLDLQPGMDSLRALYAEADAMVFPTNDDASPWVVLEAMASGVPVVCCCVGGVPDMVIDGETGLFIPPKDPAMLAAAARRLQADPELARSLSVRARQRVEEHFNAELNTQKLLQMVKDLCDAKAAKG
jgi:glycosyltransferase involved in cell wall biosynthesis